MENQIDIKNASFYYSASLLRQLLEMKLIAEEEYNKIVKINAKYYSFEGICLVH